MVVVATPNDHKAQGRASSERFLFEALSSLRPTPTSEHRLDEPTIVPMLRPAPVDTPDW